MRISAKKRLIMVFRFIRYLLSDRHNLSVPKILLDLCSKLKGFFQLSRFFQSLSGVINAAAEERTGELGFFETVDPALQTVYRFFGSVFFIFCSSLMKEGS